ncbi:MAG TPA: hypothetical protein VGR57_10650 [Ktedonobacterales bacterium]|nr:hypothetical protein [Ktedonobacterales bacterium]
MRTPKLYPLILALLLLELSLALLAIRAGPARAVAPVSPSAPHPVTVVPDRCPAPGGYAGENHWA